MTSIILPDHLAAQRAPVVEMSARDLGASGNQLLGELHCNHFWVGLCEDVLRRSNDPAEKRVARILIETGRDYVQRVEKQLADVSRHNRAVTMFKPNDQDIRQDVLQGQFDLSK